jgi:hypothetical protein
MAINGNFYDWESVEIQTPSGVSVGLTDINYNDELPIEARHGKGAKARGYGRKNYKASGSATMDRDEFERLRKAVGGAVLKAKPFPIVCAYANDDQETITDTLPDCKITKADTGAKQEDDNAGAVKIDFEILSPIKWNGEDAY